MGKLKKKYDDKEDSYFMSIKKNIEIPPVRGEACVRAVKEMAKVRVGPKVVEEELKEIFPWKYQNDE